MEELGMILGGFDLSKFKLVVTTDMMTYSMDLKDVDEEELEYALKSIKGDKDVILLHGENSYNDIFVGTKISSEFTNLVKRLVELVYEE